MKKCVFEGVATALVTPFDKRLKVDYAAFEKLVVSQLRGGVKALVVGGTTGEGSTLTEKERERLISVAATTVGGRIPVVAATGSNDTAIAIKRSTAAVEAGADALLVITPYYNKTSVNGLIRHFFAVADSVDAPVIIYNVPTRAGMDISADTYYKLSRHPNIVGVKESSGDFTKIISTAQRCKNDLYMYSGNDDTFVPFMSCGGRGIISVLSNVCPSAVVHMYNAFSRGDTARATESQMAYNGLIEALFCQVNPIPVKYALSKLGIIGNNLRLPLVPLDERYKRLVDRQMKKSGLI